MKIAVHATAAATTALAIIGVISCADSMPQVPTTSSTRSAALETSAPSSALCTDDEALGLLRLQHLRALHLAFAMRDRLTDPALRAFGDRIIEEHMNLVHEIDAASESQGGSGAQTDAGSASSSSRDVKSLGEFTDRAVEEIGRAKAEDVERVYVHHQVAEHMHAIGLIDNIIQPAARAARSSELVRRGRDLFARHVRHLYEREVAESDVCKGVVE